MLGAVLALDLTAPQFLPPKTWELISICTRSAGTSQIPIFVREASIMSKNVFRQNRVI